mgnify:CR=1 FL=1
MQQKNRGECSITHRIIRIELMVMEHNLKAIRLYEAFAFIHEGIKKRLYLHSKSIH